MSKQSLASNNRGMVAITTTLIIMILITLIVSSFSLVVRREQRQSLDRQLSTQAFYAAESGVQDAINAINRGKINNDLTDCDEFFDPSLDVGVTDGRVSADSSLGNVEYSCVLVDRELPKLNYGAIDPADGTYLIPINPGNGQRIDTIKVTWKNVSDPDTDFAPSGSEGNFPKNPTDSLKTGMPRVTLLPQEPSNRQDLNSRTRTYFMYPNTGAGGSAPGQVGFGSDGAVVGGNCRTDRVNNDDLFCASEITGIGGAPNEQYYLAVRALYQPIQMQVTATDGTNSVSLSGAQYEIDVTGRAADVLRRIRVSYSQPGGNNNRTPSSLIPTAALETSKGICKKFEVAVNSYQDLCGGNPFNPEPGVGPVEDPVINTGLEINKGNATIGGECLATETNCTPTANWPNQDPNIPPYRWNQSFLNESVNNEEDILNCTWIWGDGTQQTYQPNQCRYGFRVSYTYPNMRQLIESTNGNEGCRIYTVTLIMRFTPESKKNQETDSSTTAIPGGNASRLNGICWGKHTPYTP